MPTPNEFKKKLIYLTTKVISVSLDTKRTLLTRLSLSYDLFKDALSFNNKSTLPAQNLATTIIYYIEDMFMVYRALRHTLFSTMVNQNPILLGCELRTDLAILP